MIPGLLSTDAIWAPQIRALSDIVDIHVPNTAAKTSMEELAANVLDQLPSTFALAGHSMGGYVALEMLSQAPERIERLALLSTSARLDEDDVAQKRRDFIALAERGRFLGVSPGLFAMMVHETADRDEAIFQTVQSMANEVGAEGYVRQQTAILGRSDHRVTCEKIACPTLVLAGRQDNVVPFTASEELSRLIPHATHLALENCGHLPTLEVPDEVNGALLAWLDQ